MSRAAALVFSLLFAAGGAACRAPSPRMHVTQHRVAAGTAVVVHVEEGRRPDALWVTLVSPGAPDDFAPRRVRVDERATVAAVPAPSVGTWEVRLLGAHGVLARAHVVVEPSPVAEAKAEVRTPIWFW